MCYAVCVFISLLFLVSFVVFFFFFVYSILIIYGVVRSGFRYCHFGFNSAMLVSVSSVYVCVRELNAETVRMYCDHQMQMYECARMHMYALRTWITRTQGKCWRCNVRYYGVSHSLLRLRLRLRSISVFRLSLCVVALHRILSHSARNRDTLIHAIDLSRSHTYTFRRVALKKFHHHHYRHHHHQPQQQQQHQRMELYKCTVTSYVCAQYAWRSECSCLCIILQSVWCYISFR